MSNELQFTNAERTLSHRIATLLAVTIARELKSNAVPLTVPQQNITQQASSRAVANLILSLREEADGMTVEAQDLWIKAVALAILVDVWGLAMHEPTAEERRASMKLLQ